MQFSFWLNSNANSLGGKVVVNIENMDVDAITDSDYWQIAETIRAAADFGFSGGNNDTTLAGVRKNKDIDVEEPV